MDLFAKCYAPSLADEYRNKGIYPYFRALETRQGLEVIRDAGGKSWTTALFFGIATCGVGVLMLVNPFQESSALFTVAGVGFLFDGLTDIFTSFAVGVSKARYERLAGAAPVIELEPGAAQTLPVEGNTAATPALTDAVPESEPAEPSPAEPVAVTLEEARTADDSPEEE